MKEVVFNTWPGAFFHPGGGEVQLLNSKEELENQGIDVDLYDNWKPQYSEGIVYHQFSIEPGTESVMYAYKEKGVKIVLSPIMWNLFKPEHPRFNIVKKMFEMADILMTNSIAETERLSKCFNINISKFHETRNSIPRDFLNTITNKNFSNEFNIEGNFILSVANIDNRKNTEKLVLACKELNIQLVCIGAIREEAYFNRFKGIYEKALFLGPISDKGLIKSALQQCSLFALPSLCETPGISALEAMSQGSKIVITQVGATKEYFKNMVTYVDPSSIKSIICGIQTELNIERNKENNRKFIIENYTWSKTADDIIAGYKKLNL